MAAGPRETFCGTDCYLAPEVVWLFKTGSASSSYGSEVDIWGAGVLLFIVLSGVPPFEEQRTPSGRTLLHDDILHGRYGFEDQGFSDVS